MQPLQTTFLLLVLDHIALFGFNNQTLSLESQYMWVNNKYLSMKHKEKRHNILFLNSIDYDLLLFRGKL